MKKNLEVKFKIIVYEYVKAFEKKHGYDFMGWVGERVGEVATFSDCFINFDDMRWDIDNNIDRNIFFDWYYKSLEEAINNKAFENYRVYSKLRMGKK